MPNDTQGNASPCLSIIVLNCNLGKITRECLASIRKHTSGVNYEIIVVDNGSNPDEKLIVRRACDLFGARLIELNHNVFFGEANNIGVEAARGQFILLLNNDILVTPGYILPMLHALKTAHRAGAVGAKLQYPNGRLQEIGGYVRPDGWTIRHGLVRVPSDILSSPGLHIVDYCSAACLLLRRKIFLEAGGFDPLFDPAYFEDVDLMLRLRANGLFTYCCAAVSVIHKEGETSKAIWNKKRRATILQGNHRKFVERWGGFIERRVFSAVTPPRFEPINWSPKSNPATQAPLVFLRGPGLIRPDRTWFHIFRIAGALPENIHVVFVADEACSRCRIFVMARNWEQRLGRFSIQRSSDFNRRSDDTVIVLSATNQGGIDIASGSGPLLSRVKDLLDYTNSSKLTHNVPSVS